MGIAVGLPVFYGLSFGPTCWVAGSSDWLYNEPGRLKLVATAYRPLVSLGASGPEYISACVCWYAGLFPNGDNGRHLMAIVLGFEFLPTPQP